MPMSIRVALCAAVLATFLSSWTSTAFADGIEPGLWKITTRVEADGVVGPPRESGKCLTADETRDVAKTFSPVASTVNSECAPLERSFVDGKLLWKLVCKGQLDMELIGEFHFDAPRHYSARIRNTAVMAGRQVANSLNMLDAQWVSECTR
jgi:hypothetical protein